MRLIWATRGRDWGFQFRHTGGFADPLPEYDKVFSGLEGTTFCRRVEDKVALRFPDPEGRKDAAGRVIPHDFVVFPPEATQVATVEDGLGLVWSEVKDEYAEMWGVSKPPPPTDSSDVG